MEMVREVMLDGFDVARGNYHNFANGPFTMGIRWLALWTLWTFLPDGMGENRRTGYAGFLMTG